MIIFVRLKCLWWFGLSGWAEDSRFWLVSSHIQPQKDCVWDIRLPPTWDGYVCRPCKLSNGIFVTNWIWILWFVFAHLYSMILFRFQMPLWMCRKCSLDDFETAFFWWSCCWSCSGKCGAWCYCWYLEPGCFVLWILIWDSSIWSKGTFGHIQKVSLICNRQTWLRHPFDHWVVNSLIKRLRTPLVLENRKPPRIMLKVNMCFTDFF